MSIDRLNNSIEAPYDLELLRTDWQTGEALEPHWAWRTSPNYWLKDIDPTP